LDKGRSGKIFEETNASGTKVEGLKFSSAVMPQLAAFHPALTKTLQDRGCLEKEQ